MMVVFAGQDADDETMWVFGVSLEPVDDGDNTVCDGLRRVAKVEVVCADKKHVAHLRKVPEGPEFRHHPIEEVLRGVAALREHECF